MSTQNRLASTGTGVLQLDGWYTVVDGYGDRVLVISRSPVSHAMVLDGRRVLEAIDQGTD